MRLLAARDYHIGLCHVAAHTGNLGNSIADHLAKESARAAGCWALGALAALEGLRESGERVSLSVAVKKAGAFELFAETLARFPVSSIAHRNATLARGQLRDALESPEPPLNAREQWPMFGTHCVMS